MRLLSYINEGIKDELIRRDVLIGNERFPVIIDSTEKDTAYFPLFNLSGKFVGYQRYNPKGIKAPTERQRKTLSKSDSFKYYTYITKENPEKNIPHIAVYGLHTLDKRRYVFIVEGVFDAVKLIRLNQPVVAVLANDPKHLKNFFFILQKRVIAIMDRDDAGSKLKGLSTEHYTTPEPYKDLGDMPLDKVREFLSTIRNIRL